MLATLRLIAVFLGGGLGSLARWRVSEIFAVSGNGFPIGTFAANITGAFTLAFVSAAVFERLAPTRYVRHFVGIGFLGAYTTFSTLAVEGIRLIERGSWQVAAGYWLATIVVGQMAGVYGMWLGRLRPAATGREG